MCCVFIIIIIIITDNIMAQIRKNAAKTPSRLLPAVCSFSLLKCFNFCLYSNCSRTDSNERKIFKFKIQVIYVGYKCSVHRSVRDILHAVGLMQLQPHCMHDAQSSVDESRRLYHLVLVAVLYSVFKVAFFRLKWLLRAKAATAFSAFQPSQFCPSVCPSVRLFVCPSHGWISQKTVQAKITKSSPSAAWKTLISGTVKLFHKLDGVTPNEGAK